MFCCFLKWLCEQGFTLEEMSGFTGIEVVRIRQLLEDSGIRYSVLYASVTPEKIKEAILAYNNGMHPLELKAVYGYSIKEFRDIASLLEGEHAIPYEELDSTGKLFRQKRAWSLRKSGKKYQEIQDELGLKTKQAVGSLIKGYEKHLEKIEQTLNRKTLDGLYAASALTKVSEIIETDPHTVISRIRAILGKD